MRVRPAVGAPVSSRRAPQVRGRVGLSAQFPKPAMTTLPASVTTTRTARHVADRDGHRHDRQPDQMPTRRMARWPSPSLGAALMSGVTRLTVLLDPRVVESFPVANRSAVGAGPVRNEP